MAVKIFFCYAHEDEALLDKLKMHLRSLQRQNLIDFWYDRNISAGTEWAKEIEKHLNTADIVLLLISPAFIASDYCYGIEMQRALERREQGNAYVIPIILDYVHWQIDPLTSLQALPKDAKPVVGSGWHSQNEAFYNVAQGIRKVVEQITIKPFEPVKETVTSVVRQEDAITPTNPDDFALLRSLPVTFRGRVQSVAISPDGQVIVSGDTGNRVKVWNLHTGGLLRTLSEHSGVVRSVVISPDGQVVASGSDDNTIKLWNLHTGKIIRTLSGHSGRIYSVVISPDSRVIIGGGSDTEIHMYDIYSGQLLQTLPGHRMPVSSIVISELSGAIISGSYDGQIKIWDLYTGKLLHNLSENSSYINSVAVSSDGRMVASGADDKTAKIWSLDTEKPLYTFSENMGEVRCVTISPDGQVIASGSRNGDIKLWDLHMGRLARTLSIERSVISSLAFTPDGQTLVSAD